MTTSTATDKPAKGRWGGQLAKITPDQVRELRERYARGGVTQKALGRDYGLKQAQVSEIIRRVAWVARQMKGPYRVLVADPPWWFKDKLPGAGRGAAKHYGVMTTDAICAFELPKLHDDCWLFLWRPATHQQEALNVARAWGFRGPPSELIWRKTTKNGRLRIGMGRAFRNAHETCLVLKRGRPTRLDLGLPSVFDAPRGEHSAKPDRFYELVDQFAPGPKVELFARRQWPGWTCLGNEMPPPAEAAE